MFGGGASDGAGRLLSDQDLRREDAARLPYTQQSRRTKSGCADSRVWRQTHPTVTRYRKYGRHDD